MDKLGSAISFSCKNSFGDGWSGGSQLLGLINGSKRSRLQTRWNPGFDVEVLRASCYCERDAVDQAVDIAVLWVDSRIHGAVQLGMEQIEQIPYKSLSCLICLFLFPSFSIFSLTAQLTIWLCEVKLHDISVGSTADCPVSSITSTGVTSNVMPGPKMVHSLSHFPAILRKLNALCTDCIILCNTVYMFDPACTSYIFLYLLIWSVCQSFCVRGLPSVPRKGPPEPWTRRCWTQTSNLPIYPEFTSIDFDLLHNFI